MPSPDTMSDPVDRLYVALDTPDLAEAVALAERLQGLIGGVKLGKEFFTANGPAGVARLAEFGLPVFLDLKFHDIPTTVTGAVRATAPMKPAMINVHASGGVAMMRAAAEAAADVGPNRPLVVAVTVLTSLDDADLDSLGVSAPVREQVVHLAMMAKQCGLDGVVCSAREVMALRGACGSSFRLVVPGIRPAWAEAGDQKRIVTPSDAVALGADDLVIGRPITAAADPADAASRIVEEMRAAADAD